MSIERGERQMQTYLLPTLAIGEGSIDPQTRIINGELSEALFQEAADYLLDDKAYDIVSKAELPGWIFPSSCVDGRTLLDGSCAAGGTTSLVVADALTYRTFMQTGETVKPHAKRTAQFIILVVALVVIMLRCKSKRTVLTAAAVRRICLMPEIH
jgi:hypothetical protein